MKIQFLLLLLIIGKLAIAKNPTPLKIENDSSTQKVTIGKTLAVNYKAGNYRKWLAGSVSMNGSMGTLTVLKRTWYKNYPKSSFHTFNDNAEWLQIDKFGHAWSAYNLSHTTSALWKWTKVSDKNAILIGGLSSLSYMTTIEFLDGHSARWGWSWGDIGSNSFGTALYTSQQFFWNEQRIQYKFSSHLKKYTPAAQSRAQKLFGKCTPERLLKDYNTQTYWFSFNLHSFLPKQKLPSWFSMAVGYGAEGMFGGFDNRADKRSTAIFDATKIKRYRQWYIAPDIDLTKIRTKSKMVKTIFETLNILKFPMPALEYSNKKLKGHWLQF